jgi:hypothetical protein
MWGEVEKLVELGQAWPTRLWCPLDRHEVIVKQDSSDWPGFMRYRCETCGVEVIFMVTQVEKPSVQYAIAAG